MKNYKRRLALLLSMVMIVSSFSFMVSYAGDSKSAKKTVKAQEETAPDAATPEQPATPEPPKVPTAPTKLKVLSSYKAVKLSWTAPPELAGQTSGIGYEVYKDGKLVKDDVTATNYTFKKLDPYKKYKFSVRAFNTNNGKKQYSPKADKKGQAVRNMTFKVKLKAGGTLKSHAGKKRSLKVKRGQWLEVDRYGAGGKYIFDYKGSTFFCNLTRTGAKKEIYAKKKNYTREEAELFVNSRKLGSKTNHLIWVSTYTQHVFVFKSTDGSKKFKNKGKWKCYDDWECATGKAKTPSPTALSYKKAIWKKVSRRNGKPWWSMYSDINSFHGKFKSWKLGAPASNGCIRNPNKKAKVIYDDCKIGTMVLIY